MLRTILYMSVHVDELFDIILFIVQIYMYIYIYIYIYLFSTYVISGWIYLIQLCSFNWKMNGVHENVLLNKAEH